MKAEPKDNTAGSPSFVSRAGYVLFSILCLGLTIHIVLLVAWAWSGIESTARERSRDIVVRAVLKPGTTDRQASNIAAKLEKETPGLEATAVGRIEARTLLSVQEPWLTRLPDVEVGELPAIIEIRHPAVMDSENKMQKFSDSLGQLPEVDFIMFNTKGYKEFRNFVDGVRGYTRLIGTAIVLSALGFYLFFNLALSRHKGRHSFMAGIVYGLTIFVPSYGLAWALFNLTGMIASGKLPQLDRPGFWATVPLTVLILVLTMLLELKNVRFGPRKPKPVAKT